MAHQIIDPRGRIVSEDEGMDERGMLRDGFKLRVPMMMRDSMNDMQRAVAADKAACRFDDTLCRHQVGPVIVDRSAAAEAYRLMCEDMAQAWRGPSSAPVEAVADRRRKRKVTTRDPFGRETRTWEEEEEDGMAASDARPAIPTTDADYARLRQIRQQAYDAAKAELSEAWRSPTPAPAAAAPLRRDAAPPPRTMDAATARRIKQEAYDAMCAEMRSAWKNAVR